MYTMHDPSPLFRMNILCIKSEKISLLKINERFSSSPIAIEIRVRFDPHIYL